MAHAVALAIALLVLLAFVPEARVRSSASRHYAIAGLTQPPHTVYQPAPQQLLAVLEMPVIIWEDGFKPVPPRQLPKMTAVPGDRENRTEGSTLDCNSITSALS